MASKQLKNVFLSASIPLPERDAKYFETADIVAIRDCIIALTTVVLPKYKLIWGGHPSITPLIYYVMNRIDLNIQNHVQLYQSIWFKDIFPQGNNEFENIVYTEKLQDKSASVNLMRQQMLSENEYSAAIFIGGMDGIEEEFVMFRDKYPDILVLPIASTGAATKIIYDTLLPDIFKNERLLKDYGYMSLLQDLLIDKI
ncbi:SLOG domain-containing protein [Fibrella forsythiae]|uniref:Uncharacterized protein n=1 Tax=Fibrella forsythiae TaxID=2817061 RepID=A0ABS3JSC4_9BACT|nr:hypothetical protein [Fibrella forsythiae]MBO0952900.1 hypothetical protein [Fibrella forsythiae]